MGLHPVFQSLLGRAQFDSEYHSGDIMKLFQDGLSAAERLEVHLATDCWLASFRTNGMLYVAIGASAYRQPIEGLGMGTIDRPCDEFEDWLQGAVVFESSVTEESLRRLISSIALGMIPRVLGYLGVPPSAAS